MAEAPEVRVVDVGPSALVTLALSVAAVIVALGAARSIPRTLSALAIAALIALGLDPGVSAIQRRLRMPRAAAVGVLLAALVVFVAGIGMLLVPRATKQLSHLDEQVPRSLRQLEDVPVIGDDIARADLPARLEHVVDDLPGRLTGKGTPVIRIGLRAADGMIAVLVTLLVAIALTIDGPRLVELVRDVIPRRHRARADRIAELGYRAVGRYVTGSLTVAVVAGVFTLAIGLAFRVPLAPLLALWVMVWDLVPQIGGAAGGVPLVAMAFTQGAVAGIAVAALFVLYLQIENNVLSPLLVGGAIKLSPPATMTAALIGVSAGGVVGALLAVPLVGAAKAVYTELRPVPVPASTTPPPT